VLHCAHGNKATKISHLNSEESFKVSIDFAAREKGGNTVQISAKIKAGEKEDRRTRAAKALKEAGATYLENLSLGLRK
jgi:hypothetical protein